MGPARPSPVGSRIQAKNPQREALGATQLAKASFPTIQTNFDPSAPTPAHIQSEIKTQRRLNTLTHCTSVSDARFRGGNGTLLLPCSQVVYSFGTKENRKWFLAEKMEAIKTTDLHPSLLTPALQWIVMMKVVTGVCLPPLTVFSAL